MVAKKKTRDWNAFEKRPKPKGWNARRMRARRLAVGMSLRCAAQTVGVTHPTLLGWETGVCCPPEAAATHLDRLYSLHER